MESRESAGKSRYSDMAIVQMFSDYVTRMEDRPRHTVAAIKEAELFDIYCESVFPGNMKLQISMFAKMMNAAVEYEESGFIAGFKTAMAIMEGNDSLLPVSTDMKVRGNAQEQFSLALSNNSISDTEKSLHKAVMDSQCSKNCQPKDGRYIDTTQ